MIDTYKNHLLVSKHNQKVNNFTSCLKAITAVDIYFKYLILTKYIKKTTQHKIL